MMRLLSDIGNLAVSRGDGLFTKEQFVSGVLRELSVSLCKTNVRLEHGVSGFFVRASGVCFRHGRSRPTASAEVSDWD
jgi:NADH:ubiquinone oxidoreductase subunit D